MANHDVLTETVRILAEELGNQSAAARRLGISRSTFRSRLEAASRAGIEVVPVEKGRTPAPNQVEHLSYRVKQLESDLLLARKDALTTAAVRQEIFSLKRASGGIDPPRWAIKTKKHGHNQLIPATMWSDWHWGETVFPEQVNGINEYNLTVARERAERLTRGVVDLTMNYTVHGDYPGIVVLLGGDMVSGTIHDELTQTNDAPIMPAVVDLYGTLIRALDTLVDVFGKVFVSAVAGNHGRTTIKPQFKHAAYLNYDWLLYTLLEKRYEDDPRILFNVPAGIDAYFKIWNHRFLLTHGDKLGTSGGDGIIGMLGPVMRGMMKTRHGSSAIGLDFDTLVAGHWHQYTPLPRVIVNGSLIGPGEYSIGKLRAFPERSQQALWFVHPTNGIVSQQAVYCEAPPEQTSHEWVSWSGTTGVT